MSRRRLTVVTVVLLISGLVVAGRCLQITVFEHDVWAQRARRQHQQLIEVPGPRGTIRSADGYVLATSVSRVAVQIDTEMLLYPDIFVPAAAPLLGVSAEDCRRRLQGGSRTVWLAKKVPSEIGEQLRLLAPRAIVLVPDFARVYPLGSLAAPVIGFVGREELRTIGRAGFEHQFDAYLAGEPEQYLAVNDAIQRKVRLERLEPGRAGYDLELTLDARLQARCESELNEAINIHSARAASAVVVEIKTGRILALASLPSFDPSNPGDSSPKNWRLRPVQDAIEPGSTVKPLVAVAALAAGVTTGGERFDCRNRGVRVAGRWIRDHVDPGMYTLDEVITYSANVGIIAVAERIPEDALWRAFDAFGFGHRTGVGFPAEARGIFSDTRFWSEMSRASLALGQELTVSPLQLAMAYSAIANKGWRPRPRLVVSAGEGESLRQIANDTPVRVVGEELAGRVCSMLEAAVREGTGELASVPGYRVAGKTGTAQRVVDGTFDDQHHVAWFAGFLPMPDPQLAIVVAIEDPAVDNFWATTVAAPVFSKIAGAAITLFDLLPSGWSSDWQSITSRKPVPAGGNA